MTTSQHPARPRAIALVLTMLLLGSPITFGQNAARSQVDEPAVVPRPTVEPREAVGDRDTGTKDAQFSRPSNNMSRADDALQGAIRPAPDEPLSLGLCDGS